MCGRYYRRSEKQEISERFRVGKVADFPLAPDYNIAPSTFQPIIRPDPETGERSLVQMRWGLIPAKIADPDGFKIYTTSNARSETILHKPIWKGPFLQSRCLIPIDGFYELGAAPLLAPAAAHRARGARTLRRRPRGPQEGPQAEGGREARLPLRDATRGAVRPRRPVLRVAATQGRHAPAARYLYHPDD
jgi:hypothetical protein